MHRAHPSLPHAVTDPAGPPSSSQRGRMAQRGRVQCAAFVVALLLLPGELALPYSRCRAAICIRSMRRRGVGGVLQDLVRMACCLKSGLEGRSPAP